MAVTFLIALVAGFILIGIKGWFKPNIFKSNATAISSKPSNTTDSGSSSGSSSRFNSGSSESDSSSNTNNENNDIISKPYDIPQQLWDDAIAAYKVIVAEHDGIKYGTIDPNIDTSPNSSNVMLAWLYKYRLFIDDGSIYYQQQFPQLYQDSYHKRIRLINAIYYMSSAENSYKLDMSNLLKDPFHNHGIDNDEYRYESYKKIADEILNISSHDNTPATPRQKIVIQNAMEQLHNYIQNNLETLTKKLKQINAIKKSDSYSTYPACHDDVSNWQPKLSTGEKWIAATQDEKNSSASDVVDWLQCKDVTADINADDLVSDIDNLLQFYPEDRRYNITLISLALFELVGDGKNN